MLDDKTVRIPRYSEENNVDHWHEATHPSEDPMHFEGRLKSDGERIKERNLALMTAAVLWFMLLCGFSVAAAIMLKLIGLILAL